MNYPILANLGITGWNEREITLLLLALEKDISEKCDSPEQQKARLDLGLHEVPEYANYNVLVLQKLDRVGGLTKLLAHPKTT